MFCPRGSFSGEQTNWCLRIVASDFISSMLPQQKGWRNHLSANDPGTSVLHYRTICNTHYINFHEPDHNNHTQWEKHNHNNICQTGLGSYFESTGSISCEFSLLCSPENKWISVTLSTNRKRGTWQWSQQQLQQLQWWQQCGGVKISIFHSFSTTTTTTSSTSRHVQLLARSLPSHQSENVWRGFVMGFATI
jgi:hypothetical protein